MNWQFHIIQSWDDIWSDKHLAQWQNHLNQSPNAHVFFHPALVRAWVETYLPLRNLTPLFVWAQHDSGCTAFLPLVLWKKNWRNAWMKSIVPAGYSDFDYHDPVFSTIPDSPNNFWNELMNELRSSISWDEIQIDGLHDSCQPVSWHMTGEEPCPYISLTGFQSIDDYLATRSKKMRYNLKRQRKKAEETAELSFHDYSAQDIPEALAELPLMLSLHAQRWPNAYKAPQFHNNLISEGLKNHILHFSKLSFNDQPASWRIGFYFKDRYYSYMPTINPQFFQFGPGKIHLLHCIQFAIDHRLTVYDQLRGSELYKSEWTQEADTIHSAEFQKSSPSLTIKFALLNFKKRLQHS